MCNKFNELVLIFLLIISCFFGLTGKYYLVTMALGLVMIFSIRVSARERIKLFSNSTESTFLLFLFFASLLWADLSTSQAVKTAINFLFLYQAVLILNQKKITHKFLVFFNLFYWLFVFLNILIVYAYPSIGIMKYDINDMSESTAWKGLFAHKNQLGRFCIVGYILTLYYLKRALVVKILLIVIIFYMQLKTQSLGSLFFCVLTLGFIKLKAIYLYLKKINLLYLGVIALFFVLPLAFTLLQYLFDASGRSRTLTGRVAIWSLAIDGIVKEPFLGYGLYFFWSDLYKNVPSDFKNWIVPTAHNTFLEYFLNFGVPLTLIFFVILFYKFCFKYMWIKNTRLNEMYKFVIIFYVLCGITDTTFYPTGPICLFVLFLIALERFNENSRKF